YLEDVIMLKQEIMKRKSRADFWEYCKVMADDFYKEVRCFLKDLTHEMQSFYESDTDEVLIVNAPPRHGKSRTGGKFVEWVLGQDINKKIMTGSYNERLSTTFSRSVRNTIREEKADLSRVVYSDIFPNTRIKHGESNMSLWSLEGSYNNYLATSPTGTATGFGADILIIDDLVKNAEEAFNDTVLEKHWDWFTQTMLSRLQEGGKIIIVMTRWSTKDLAGMASRHFKEEGAKIREVKMKAVQDDGTMLDDKILSYESYKSKIRAMGKEVASANFQQEPINIKGKLYSKFKTYSKLVDFKRIINYKDTYDTGGMIL